MNSWEERDNAELGKENYFIVAHRTLVFSFFFLASQNYWTYSVAFFLAELQPPEIKSSVLFYHSELQ